MIASASPWFILVPLLVGALTVFQGTLNRHLGGVMGLASAVLLNAFAVTVLAIGLYAAVRLAPESFPPLFRGAYRPGTFKAWMLLPGLFGFLIIAGIPWAIGHLGAARVFVAIVVAQIVVSLLWDTLAGGVPITWQRVAGAGLAMAGVLLASFGSPASTSG